MTLIYPEPHTNNTEQQKNLKRRFKKRRFGFFRTRYKSGWHVGVYLIDGWFVHSKSRVGVAIDNLRNPSYTRIYYGAGRHNEIKQF
jgi:cell wall-associated NlpC family hydrolase